MKRKILHIMVLLFMLWLNSSAQEAAPPPEAIPASPGDSWIQKADFTAVRYGMFSFSIDNKGYAGTGVDNVGNIYSDFWEYDPATNAWTQKADCGGGIRYYATGFSVNGKGYAGTGISGSYQWKKDMWQYDPATNNWQSIADFAGGYRYAMVGFGIGNKGYLGTGNYRESPWVLATYYNDFWQYDPTTDIWTRKADVPELGRTNAVGISLNNKGYIGCGFYYYDTRKNDWWQYDPATDTWTRKADIPATPRFDPNAFAIANKVFVCGGWYYNALADLWEYDINTDSWTQRSYTPLSAKSKAITFSIGDKAYLGTGYDNTGYGTNDFWEYTPVETIPTFSSCPSNQTIYTTNETCSNSLIYEVIATGNPGISYSFTGATVASGPGTGSGQTFNQGVTNVIISATNTGGTATCSFSVEVLDRILPVIKCAAAQNLCYQPGNSYTIPQLTATDNCSIQTIQYAITGATTRSGAGVDASGLFNPGISTIKWKVTDNSGNVSECNTTVTIKPKFTVAIPDTYPLLIWGRVNTLFIGFGTTCAPLIAVPSGGTPYPGLNPYRYAWSNGGNLIATLACPPSAPGSYTFTVTVTDAAGCTATASKTIYVVDARCGPRNNEVLICWYGRSQSCYQQWQAVLALSLGAQVGACNLYSPAQVQRQIDPKEGLVVAQDKIMLFPNPSGHYFNLNVQSEKAEQLHVRIFDAFGRRIEELNGSVNKTYTFGHQYKPGIYVVEVQQGIEKHTFKAIKL